MCIRDREHYGEYLRDLHYEVEDSFLEGLDDHNICLLYTSTCTDKCAAGAVNTGCEICKNDLTKCEGKEPEVVDPKFTISILAPDGWYTNRANVETVSYTHLDVYKRQFLLHALQPLCLSP